MSTHGTAAAAIITLWKWKYTILAATFLDYLTMLSPLNRLGLAPSVKIILKWLWPVLLEYLIHYYHIKSPITKFPEARMEPIYLKL
jgi:hypothetical protein